MEKKRNYYIDWWSIKNSTIYGLVAVLALIAALAGGLWYAKQNNWFQNTGISDTPKDAGILLNFEGDVRIIRATTREIIVVKTQTYVSAGDTVQTQADGKATIRMIDGSTLSVRPNSTVIIRDSSSVFGGTNVRVALDDGQINVKTEEQAESSQNIVEVKEVENKLQSQTDASFKVNPETGGGEIRISRGTIESTAGGEKTILKENEYVAINQNKKLSPKEKLLEPPKLTAPASLDQLLTSSSGTTDTTFRWQKSDPSTTFSYRIEVANSPFFVPDSLLISREGLGNPTFSIANINPGTYYWRVRAQAATGQITEWSEPWRFTVIKRDGSEKLKATDWKTENVGGKVFIISGRTDPGATVNILGREMFAGGDGSFRLQVSVPGTEVTVEIRDEHGNQTRYVVSVADGRVLRHY